MHRGLAARDGAGLCAALLSASGTPQFTPLSGHAESTDQSSGQESITGGLERSRACQHGCLPHSASSQTALGTIKMHEMVIGSVLSTKGALQQGLLLASGAVSIFGSVFGFFVDWVAQNAPQ